jgi:hypothetical protein
MSAIRSVYMHVWPSNCLDASLRKKLELYRRILDWLSAPWLIFIRSLFYSSKSRTNSLSTAKKTTANANKQYQKLSRSRQFPSKPLKYAQIKRQKRACPCGLKLSSRCTRFTSLFNCGDETIILRLNSRIKKSQNQQKISSSACFF